MLRTATILVAASLLAAPSTALGQALGAEGESCRARADCEAGLRCLDNVCTAPAEAAAEEPAAEEPAAEEPAAEEPAEPAGDSPAARWAAFELGGTHFFGGVTVAPGLSGYWPYGSGVDVRAALLFGLRVGVLFDRVELAAELAPVTWWWDFDADPLLTFNLSIGGLIELAHRVYWPMRFGLGLAAVDTPTGEVYMLGRLDLIGLAYQYGHLIFELSLPSVRYCTEFQQLALWSWIFNISISYVI